MEKIILVLVALIPTVGFLALFVKFLLGIHVRPYDPKGYCGGCGNRGVRILTRTYDGPVPCQPGMEYFREEVECQHCFLKFSRFKIEPLIPPTKSA